MYNALNQFDKISDDSSIMIIGDMKELGEYSNQEHLMVLNQLENIKGIKVLVGKCFYEFKNDYHFTFFENVSGAVHYLNNKKIEGALILIKGSRGMALEKVVSVL